jgi:hypothetical protein
MVWYNLYMHKLYELVVPSWAETFLYLAVSLVLLLILNAGALWTALLHSAGTDTATAKSIDNGLRVLVTHLTTLSNPQLVNAFVWGATAALGVFVAVAVTGFIRATRDSASDLHSRRGEISFAEILTVRLAALGSTIIAALFGVFGLLPVFSYLFVTRLTDISASWQNGPTALMAWFGVATTGYLLAVLCRLVVLRVRVFSTTID